MTTLTDRSHTNDLQPETGQTRQRNRYLTVAVIVLALAAIGLGIWALSERNQASDLSDDLAAAEATVSDLEADLAASEATIAELETEPAATEDPLIVGGGPLTERQQEVLAVATGYLDAVVAKDGDLAATFMTDDAELDYLGRIYRVDDRSLQLGITSDTSQMALQSYEVEFVDDEVVVVSGKVTRESGTRIDVYEFTGFGEPKINRGTIFLSLSSS